MPASKRDMATPFGAARAESVKMDRGYSNWMWSEACDMLARADHLHRQLFRPMRSAADQAAWEPPVDILETKTEVLIFVALPGVPSDKVETVIDGADLIIAGHRVLPAQLQTAAIHRLELPQGRFSRRVRLPAGRYASVTRSASDGCLLISLKKAAGGHG
jgi:HSP20 family molecular chaperone IbpA